MNRVGYVRIRIRQGDEVRLLWSIDTSWKSILVED
jgi:hypothetical protein